MTNKITEVEMTDERWRCVIRQDHAGAVARARRVSDTTGDQEDGKVKTSELRKVAEGSGAMKQWLAAEVIRLREALDGAANVLDLLRTYGKGKYDCASSRAGTLVYVAPTIDAARALLTEHDDE